MSTPGNGQHEYVTNQQLASELRAFRWEFRCLLALSWSSALAVAYKVHVPPVPDVVQFIAGLF